MLCPIGECKKPIDQHDLQKGGKKLQNCVDQDHFKLFEKYTFEHTLVKMELVQCPGNNCENRFEANRPTVYSYECEACKERGEPAVYCPNCLGTGHDGRTCAEEKEIKQRIEQNNVNDVAFDNLMKAQLAIKCPNEGCKIWCGRISGCNKVVCARCQTWMCFGCTKEWDKETARGNYCRSPHMRCQVVRNY